MPELPEVETIRRELEVELVGRTIRSVDVRVPKLIRTPLARFKKLVIGARVSSVERRAKLLLIGLSNGQTLLVHLKLTGQLIFRSKKKTVVGGHPQADGTIDLPNKFTHLIFSLSGAATLFYNDLRKFGFFKLVPTIELGNYLEDQGYGPEPLARDFTPAVLTRLIAAKRSGRIKQVLMDQTFIAGVGNIYADEALFRSRIHPSRPVASLKPNEVAALYRAIRKVLLDSLAQRGTSADQYLDAYGRPGGYRPFLAVYGREGEPCRRCRTIIKRIKMGGRSAHFCPHCQREHLNSATRTIR